MSTNDVVLIDFWALWCGPCRQFAPIYEQVSEKHPDVVFGRVDTEAEHELAAAANITSIPTVMAFRDGICVFSQPGTMPAAGLDQLIAAVRALDMAEVRAKIAAARTSDADAADARDSGDPDIDPEPESPAESGPADPSGSARRGGRPGVDYPDEHGAIV